VLAGGFRVGFSAHPFRSRVRAGVEGRAYCDKAHCSRVRHHLARIGRKPAWSGNFPQPDFWTGIDSGFAVIQSQSRGSLVNEVRREVSSSASARQELPRLRAFDNRLFVPFGTGSYQGRC
jgi:hypothetical protein